MIPGQMGNLEGPLLASSFLKLVHTPFGVGDRYVDICQQYGIIL